MSTTSTRPVPGRGATAWVPGEVGLWVFILGDMGIFALFFGIILTTRAQHPDLVASGQAHLHPELAVVNTVLLLVGSYLAVRGVAAARAGRPVAARWFAGTVSCGAGFASIKAVEYLLLANSGLDISGNDFVINYLVFTAIHLVHLVIGVVLMIVLAAVCRRPSPSPAPASTSRVRLVEAGGVYWHMVDLLWLVLFPLLYLLS